MSALDQVRSFLAGPMSFLETAGPAGSQVQPLLRASLAFSILMILLIGALVLVGILVRSSPHRRPQDHPVTSRAASGPMWIGIGTGLSALALMGFMAWMVRDMAAIASTGQPDALTVEVRAHQWWWEFRYLDNDPAQIFTTANELHIPVGRPVRFRLISTDVIHSFWVPRLGGKTDVIPGQTNIAWLEADVPGTYRGQCADYCGAEHAYMALIVHADTKSDFDRWRAGQIAPAVVPAGEEAANGAGVFLMRCAACHTIRGTPAGGKLGPDLTHLMSRTTIAAGMLPNTEAYLSGWIANPQTLKPDSLMPNLDLSSQELDDVRSYLLAQK